MHPRTQEVLAHLDTHRSALERAVVDVPTPMHRKQPGEGRWSVAEILEHLSLVEGRISQLLTKELDAARVAGLGAEQDTSAVTPTLDVARLLDRSRPLTASESSTPTGTLDTNSAFDVLRAHRRTLRDAVVAADGRALGTIQIPHPRLGTLNVYQWLVFLGAHEARHTEQVREVGAALTA